MKHIFIFIIIFLSVDIKLLDIPRSMERKDKDFFA